MKTIEIRHLVLQKLRNNPYLLSKILFIYFYILSLINGIKLYRINNKIFLSKNNRKIILSASKSSDFGATGIVVRDYNNFFNSIVPINNVIDFSTPKFHEMTNGQKYFFHDICEPLTTTKIYVDMANLKGRGEVVLDLGAYCGTQTVDFSTSVGKNGKVIAFEPDETSFSSLKKNITLAKYQNIKCHKMAVYSHDGVIKFETTGGMASSVVPENEKVDEFDKINSSVQDEVKCITLDSIALMHNLQRCDFVKMDIEGSELNVLKSSISFIKKYSPSFIIEPHKINGKMNTEEIIRFFEEINFKCIKLKQGDQSYQPLLYAHK